MLPAPTGCPATAGRSRSGTWNSGTWRRGTAAWRAHRWGTLPHDLSLNDGIKQGPAGQSAGGGRLSRPGVLVR